METRTWPYGTQLTGTVVKVIAGREPLIPKLTVALAVREGFVMMGVVHDSAPIEGDIVALVFCKGGPTGGYWKITHQMNTNDPLYLSRLKLLREIIPNHLHLALLFDGTGGKAAEKEEMVAQTIAAAVLNLAEHGEPFSFRHDPVYSNAGKDAAGSVFAFNYLVTEGYFVEAKRTARDTHEEHDVIFPTEKLLTKLEEYFIRKTA